jgi:hypothetical protein
MALGKTLPFYGRDSFFFLRDWILDQMNFTIFIEY